MYQLPYCTAAAAAAAASASADGIAMRYVLLFFVDDIVFSHNRIMAGHVYS